MYPRLLRGFGTILARVALGRHTSGAGLSLKALDRGNKFNFVFNGRDRLQFVQYQILFSLNPFLNSSIVSYISLLQQHNAGDHGSHTFHSWQSTRESHTKRLRLVLQQPRYDTLDFKASEFSSSCQNFLKVHRNWHDMRGNWHGMTVKSLHFPLVGIDGKWQDMKVFGGTYLNWAVCSLIFLGRVFIFIGLYCLFHRSYVCSRERSC